jgi:YVTN family beta-propeller protein
VLQLGQAFLAQQYPGIVGGPRPDRPMASGNAGVGASGRLAECDERGRLADPGRLRPTGVAVTPDGSKVYVANQSSNTVSVINTATNAVGSITVGSGPVGGAVTPDGSEVYVANFHTEH